MHKLLANPLVNAPNSQDLLITPELDLIDFEVDSVESLPKFKVGEEVHLVFTDGEYESTGQVTYIYSDKIGDILQVEVNWGEVNLIS